MIVVAWIQGANAVSKSGVYSLTQSLASEWASRGVPTSLMITKPFAPAQVVVAISSLMVASDTAP